MHGNSTTGKNISFESVIGEGTNGRGKLQSEVFTGSIEHRRMKKKLRMYQGL